MTRALIAAALATLLAAPVAAQGIPLLPPAEYDLPWPGPVDIQRIHATNVARECTDPGKPMVHFATAGCSRVMHGTCEIIVATRSPRASAADIIRHEIAHCWGWVH